MTTDDERRQILDVLSELGVAEAEVPADPFDAAALASDVVLGREDEYSLRQLAVETGKDVADLEDSFRHLGINVPDHDRVMFSKDDIMLARNLEHAVAEIFDEEEGQEILHIAGTALATIAEAGVASHVQGPERRTANVVENARLNAAIAELGLQLGQTLSAAFRHHLRQTAVTQRRTQSETHRELVTLAVGFLDLVGFTTLSQELEPNALVVLVKAFERRAHELAHDHRARIVKLIGDEVMIVAEDPVDAAAFVTGMIASLDDDGVVPRGGLAFGALVNIHGDYFGPVVNLAARLTDSAVPGEVLVDDAVAERVSTEPAGRRMLKGFDEPVRVHTLLTDEQP